MQGIFISNQNYALFLANQNFIAKKPNVLQKFKNL